MTVHCTLTSLPAKAATSPKRKEKLWVTRCNPDGLGFELRISLRVYLNATPSYVALILAISFSEMPLLQSIPNTLHGQPLKSMENRSENQPTL